MVGNNFMVMEMNQYFKLDCVSYNFFCVKQMQNLHCFQDIN
jgi:hypothetical protein